MCYGLELVISRVPNVHLSAQLPQTTFKYLKILGKKGVLKIFSSGVVVMYFSHLTWSSVCTHWNQIFARVGHTYLSRFLKCINFIKLKLHLLIQTLKICTLINIHAIVLIAEAGKRWPIGHIQPLDLAHRRQGGVGTSESFSGRGLFSYSQHTTQQASCMPPHVWLAVKSGGSCQVLPLVHLQPKLIHLSSLPENVANPLPHRNDCSLIDRLICDYSIVYQPLHT